MKKKPAQAKFTITLSYTPELVAKELLASGIKLPGKLKTQKAIIAKLKTAKGPEYNIDNFFTEDSFKVMFYGSMITHLKGMEQPQKLEMPACNIHPVKGW